MLGWFFFQMELSLHIFCHCFSCIHNLSSVIAVGFIFQRIPVYLAELMTCLTAVYTVFILQRVGCLYNKLDEIISVHLFIILFIHFYLCNVQYRKILRYMYISNIKSTWFIYCNHLYYKKKCWSKYAYKFIFAI